MTAYDGTPQQAGLEQTSLTGAFPQFSILGFREMVVVGRRYVKDTFNRSKTQVEYILRDVKTGDIFPGARRADQMGGALDGDDDVLHPATLMRVKQSGAVDQQTPAVKTDGDRVFVGFINGSRSQPVIIGVLRHPDATYGATEDDGERRLTKHKGTTIEIKKDGDYVITHKSGSTIRLLENGDIEVVAAGNVLLGDAETVGLTGEGVVVGTAIDPFTGQTQNALQNASAKVFAKR